LKAVRAHYEEHGADDYYKNHATSYENPHFKEIKTLLIQNIGRFDATNVLDLSAGGGEVSQVLLELKKGNITGCDPFTFDLFEKKIGIPCLRHSFMDIVKGVELAPFTTIICSFAMHLCPEKDLFPLVWNLFQVAPALIIITPHKRPALEELPGVTLIWEDFALTERGKKVKMKYYELEKSQNTYEK
jgi:hypothetical protein